MSVISKLQIVLEASTTAFDRNLSKVNDQLGKFSKSVQDMHAKMDKFERKNREALQGLQTAGKVAAVGLGVMAVGIKGAVTAAVDFEKSMAGVKKVIDFETPEQFRQMEQDIIALSQHLPMAATDIAAIMEAAGQSGIARDELTRFAESAVKMGVAFDITAEEAGKAMAEMRASFGMTQTEVETLADQINYLGNNSTNSAPHIMEVVQRIGSLAEMANISSSTIAALTASMVGIAPEVAATSLKNFSLQLVKGESLSKSAKAAFVQMGLDYNQVAKDMQTDSEGTIRKVLEAVQKVPEHMRAAVLNDAFGSESIAAISQLVTNIDTVDKNLKAMGDSATYAGSMLNEFKSMAGTSAAQMQLFDNNMQAMKIAFGTAFLPVLNQAMEAITPVIKSITDWAQKNPELVTTITAIVGGVLGAIAALGGLALAFTAVTGGIGAMVSIGKMIAVIISPIFNVFSAVKMFGAALAALGFPVTAVVAGIAALVAGAVLLWQNWDTVKAKAIEVWNAIPEYANQAWQWIQGVWDGVGAWFGGIWDSIKSGISTKIDEIKQAFNQWLSSMLAPVQEMVANIISIFDTWLQGMKILWDGLTAVAKVVVDVVVALWRGAVGVISSIWSGIVSVATTIWNGIVSAVSDVVDAIKPIISSVVSFFSSVWQGLVGVAKSVWEGIKSVVSTAMTAIKAIFTAQLTIFASVFNAGFALVKNIFTTTFNVIKSLVRGDMNGVRQAFKDGFDRAVQIAKKAKDDIVGALRDLGKRLIQMGRDAIQGLINGMSEKIGAAVAKAQELAGKVIGAVKGAFDIHSPSRVMKALGGFAGEGFALGLGEKVKDAKKVAQELASAVTSTISELHKNHFMLQNHANPLAELDYKLQFGELAELTDAQKARIKELAQANLDLAKSNEALTGFNNQMSDLSRQIALLGVDSPIKQLEYDLANSEKYAGYTTEQLDKLKSKMIEFEQTKALQGFNSELEKATTEMQKQEYLLKNIGDKYAGMNFDLAQKGYNNEQIGQMVGVQQRTDTITAFGNLQANLQKGKAFTLPTFGGQGLEGAGNALASGISGMASLDKQYQEQLDIIRQSRQAQLDINADYDKQERDLKAAHEAAKRELTLSSAEGVASGLASATKSMFGEQSKAYRAMFAMEQGVAIARSVMAIQQAIAMASANPFPMNLGAMATVSAQTMGIVAKIKAIKNPIVGQAHDGIMSVPKSGTWNLEKGERVLPKYTAQNLDNTLNRLQGRGEAKVIINNYTGEKTDVQQMPNGDMMVTIGKMIDNKVNAMVNQRFMQARRQGGELYGR